MTIYSGISSVEENYIQNSSGYLSVQKLRGSSIDQIKCTKEFMRGLCCFEEEEKERGQVSVLNPPGNIVNQ